MAQESLKIMFHTAGFITRQENKTEPYIKNPTVSQNTQNTKNKQIRSQLS